MKIICIDDSNQDACWGCGGHSNNVKQLSQYNVSAELDDTYILRGKETCKCGQRQAFYKRRFIPLSDIDETELVNESIKTTAI